jgi:hypothetical protein
MASDDENTENQELPCNKICAITFESKFATHSKVENTYIL